MTADTITAIKKALEGVTPGPWGYVASNENHGPYVCNDWGAGDICDGYVMSKPDSLSIRNGGDSKPINHQNDEADANMRFIAAFNPDAISQLLSTLESLQRENEGLRAMFTYLNENSALELVWQEVNGDPSECGWHLFRRFGGRSDRDFKVVGTGETVEQAITLAMERAYE